MNRDWLYEHADPGAAHWHAALLAELLLAAGSVQEAASVEPRLVAGTFSDLVDRAENLPRLALTRARALEGLGRSGDALRQLEAVIA